MENEEIAGYLIRLELKNGEDRFWNVSEEWVEDPGDAELYEEEATAEAVVEKLNKEQKLDITIEEVIYDDDDSLFDEDDKE